ncbi:MAG: protoporphyrinogen oxidase [Gemmatimonadales bacterium]|nr:MAG: protoporphyrinogen oxidase [Gemmatimonadales bacterium]
MTRLDAVVVGGGVSGMGAAWALHRAGVSVRVLEAGPEVGGVVRSVTENGSGEGLLLELGPQTLSTRDPALLGALADLGLEAGMLEADSAGGRRYVVHRGVPVAVPHGPGGLLSTPLLSPGAKVRLLTEPFRRRGGERDESVASFVRRRLGPQVLERLVDPFVSGVFAGDPETLALGAIFPDLVEAEARHGSVVRGMLARGRSARAERGGAPRPRSRILSFDGGLQSWPRAVARRLGKEGLEVDAGVHMLSRDNGSGSWRVAWDGGELQARSVILATPARAAAGLVEALDPEAAGALRGLPYAPVTVVHLAWPRASVAHALDGFGALVPSAEGRRVLGSLWPGTLFPLRLPQDLVLTANFVGGARTPERASLSENDILALVREELEALLGARGTPSLARVTRWPEAIPQYVRGHGDRIAAVERLEAGVEGLRLAGNWRGGVSLGAAWSGGVAAGQAAASALGALAEG